MIILDILVAVVIVLLGMRFIDLGFGMLYKTIFKK